MDGHSSFFDLHAREWDKRKTLKEIKKIKKILAGLGIRKGEHILDAGCGTGFLFPLLMEYIGDGGCLSGADISEKMVDMAKKKFKDKKIDYIISPVKSLPVNNSVFDRIICYSSFPHFPQKEKVLKEFKRVLKKGGKLHIIHSSSRGEINSHHMKIGGAVKDDRLPGKGRMEKLLACCGFVKIKVQDRKDSYIASAALPPFKL